MIRKNFDPNKYRGLPSQLNSVLINRNHQQLINKLIRIVYCIPTSAERSMQGSEVLNSYPWNYHGQHSMHENNKQEYTLESEFLPLKYNNGEYKIEAKSIPIVCPAPFEHPVSYSESSKLDEDQFISQFTEQGIVKN